MQEHTEEVQTDTRGERAAAWTVDDAGASDGEPDDALVVVLPAELLLPELALRVGVASRRLVLERGALVDDGPARQIRDAVDAERAHEDEERRLVSSRRGGPGDRLAEVLRRDDGVEEDVCRRAAHRGGDVEDGVYALDGGRGGIDRGERADEALDVGMLLDDALEMRDVAALADEATKVRAPSRDEALHERRPEESGCSCYERLGHDPSSSRWTSSCAKISSSIAETRRMSRCEIGGGVSSTMLR